MYSTADEAKAMIAATIETMGGNPSEYDLDQILDATFEYSMVLHVYLQDVDESAFLGEVTNGAWNSEYKAQMAAEYPADADEILGRNR